jgi:hypothetical protein
MRLFILLCVAGLCFESTALGAELFSFSTGQGGQQPGRTDYITIPIGSAIPNQYAGPPIFASVQWTPADVGTTVTITPASDPNFAAFTSKLTDGVSQSVSVSFYPAPAQNLSGAVFPEPFVIWGNQNDPRVDLHGYDIQSYTERLNSLSIDNLPDGTSGYNASVTFSAEGVPLPEPGAFGAVVLGLAVVCRSPARKQ